MKTRKITKKALAVLLAMSVLFIAAISVSAAETIQLDGYPDIPKDEYIAEYQISISNVTGENTDFAIDDMTKTYSCIAPVVVKEIDKLDTFYVAPLVLTEDGTTYMENGYYAPNGEYRSEDYWSNFEDIMMEFRGKENGEITITEPGIYMVSGGYSAMAGGVCAVIVVEEGNASSTPAAETIFAKYTNSTVMVNGVNVEFEAYNINGNNYFKLRDLAMALNGTEASFSVEWSEADNSIVVERGSYMGGVSEAYVPVGGELVKGDGQDKMAYVSAQNLLAPMDGGFPGFTAYNINGNNYFKLRDIGELFEFEVDWDGANNCVIIDTTKPYTAD